MMRIAFVCVGLVLGGATMSAGEEDDRRLPNAADLRPQFESFGLAPKAQGQRDTCSLFAITGLVEFEIAKSDGPNGPGRLSEEYLIWAANEAAGGTTDQAMFYEAVCGLETFGICSQKLMPYRTGRLVARGPSQVAGRDGLSRNTWQPHWIKRWDVKSGLSAAQLHTLKQQLASEHPVAVGLRWPKTGQRPDQIIDVPPPDQVFDGHSVLFVGYRDDAQQPGGGVFTFRNSAGTTWGEKGYGTMSYAYAATYANDALALHVTDQPVDGQSQKRLWFEAEALRPEGTCQVNVQDMSAFGGKMWSDGTQVLAGCEKGGTAEFTVPVPTAGRYAVTVLMTCAPDFGQCSFAINGTSLGDEFDAYSGRVHPSGRIRLGEVELASGKHRLTITSTGKNALSEGFKLGIDAIALSAAE